MEFHSNLSRFIQLRMKEREVSKADLARELDVTPQRVTQIIRSDDLKWSTIMRICYALDITPNDLLV